MMDLGKAKIEFQKQVDFCAEELKKMRSGRASAEMVDGIAFEAYGTLSHIKHMASVSVPDARTLLISPWDKSILADIEKALIATHLGATPVNDGASIRLVLPSLTEENRKQLVKVIGQKCEQAKIALRNLRDSLRDEVQRSEREKEITEDDRYDLYKKIDELTKGYTTQIDEMASKKENEIMTL